METPLEATKDEDEDEDEDEESVARAQECLLQALIAHTARELPQRELDQDWAVLGELGSGSYGRVVLAEPRDGGARVALKLLSKERTAKWGFLREFCTHLCLQGAFTCIQVLPLAFETPTEFGFAQELAPAGDLCSLLTPGVGLPEPQVKRCASQVSAALAYLHGHALVHRDLKLDNVLAFDPECHLVKLSDFGLTRVLGWQVRPAPGATPYAAPELWHLRASEARLRLEPTLDTWAFGVLLFALLTGSFPWASPAHSDPAFRCFQAWHGRTCAGEVPPRPPRTWRGLGEAALGLLRGLLHPHPARRSPPGEVLRYLGRPWAGGAGQVSAEGEEGSGQVSTAGENGSRQGSSSGESGQVSSAGENGSGQASSPGEGGSSQVSVAGEGGSGQGSSSGESESGQASSEGEGGSSQVSSAGEGEQVSPAGKSGQGSPSGESSQVSFSGESGQMSPEDEGWGSQVSSAGKSGQVSSAGEGGSVQVSPAGESCQVSSSGEDGQRSSSGESSQVSPAGDSGSPSSEVETPGQVMETPEHGTETPGSGSGTPEDEIETPGQGMETPRSWIETHGQVVDTPGSELEVLGDGIEAPGQVRETPGTGLETPGVRRKHLEMG